MKVLVTGADGFVGRWMVGALTEAGHEVTGASLHQAPPTSTSGAGTSLGWRTLDLRDPESVRGCADLAIDGLIHLAAVSSVTEAATDPSHAWEVNLLGTIRLLEEVARRGNPRVLLISSGEVYGRGGPEEARLETDPLRPCSVYAATKAAAEIAALELSARSGLPVMVARPFPHTGPGQEDRFVVPAFARRIQEARRQGQKEVRTGNLDPVRDLLDVRDVVQAYVLLLERGAPGEIYNVSRGVGVSLRTIYALLTELIGADVSPAVDPGLVRTADIPHLVGRSDKLAARTGWQPHIDLPQTLRDVVDAQAD